MTRGQAKLYIAGGIILAGMGQLLSGPEVPGFNTWLILPTIMIIAGIIRLLQGS